MWRSQRPTSVEREVTGEDGEVARDDEARAVVVSSCVKNSTEFRNIP